MLFNTHMRQDQPWNEEVMLERFSTLLKGFKKMLKTVEEIITEMVTDEDYNPHLKQLSIIVTELEKTAQDIDYSLPSDNDIESIFLRFVNRLSEQIVNVSKPNLHYTGSNYIEKLLSKVQECIKMVMTSRNVGALFLSLFSIFKQFTLVAERLYYAEPLPQDGIFVQKNLANTQNNVWVKQQQAQTPPPVPPKESQFHKVMNVLNRYYSSLNCLDLDFSSFKTFYFQTRTQTQENLVEQMKEKNGIVGRALTKYNKRFNDFKRKKQKLEPRRTKIVSLQDLQPINPPYVLKQRHTMMSTYNKRQNHQIQLEEQITTKVESSQQLKNPQKIEYKEQESGTDNQSVCKKKSSYQIKNVYLTFRKPLRHDKDGFMNPSIFQTVLKPIDLSKTIQENDNDKKRIKINEKHVKLSPVKLISFGQPNLRECLLQQLQSHKITMLGIGKAVGIIHNNHNNNMRKHNKEVQGKPIRASSFARKLSKQFRFRGQDRVFKTIQKQNLYQINDEITL